MLLNIVAYLLLCDATLSYHERHLSNNIDRTDFSPWLSPYLTPWFSLFMRLKNSGVTEPNLTKFLQVVQK